MTVRDTTSTLPGAVRGMPALLLRLEGLGVFGLALFAYAALGESWWLFGAVILAPDLSMLGYLAGPGTGAVVYNGAHSYLGPALLGGVSYSVGAPLGLALALIWAAHIGLDRAIGYGLKYPDDFGATHLGRLGRGSARRG